MQCRLGIANIKKLNIRQNKTQTYVNLGTIRQSRWLTKRYMVNINFTVFINILGSSQRKVVPLLASPCPCVRRSSWKWLKDFHEISWCVFLINKYAKFLRLHIWINYTQFVYYATRFGPLAIIGLHVLSPHSSTAMLADVYRLQSGLMFANTFNCVL
jgi:predicted membrane-bound dolichyl-phosphate-mannose-protein mannosyltransferase